METTRLSVLAEIEKSDCKKPYSFESLEKMINKTESSNISEFLHINEMIGSGNLKQAAIGHLHKLIKEKSNLNIGQLKSDISIAINKLTQDDLLQKTIERIGNTNILYTNGMFYLWDKQGVWKASDDKVIKKEIHSVHRQENIEIISSQIEAVCNLCRTEVFKPNHIFNVGKNRINCINGELEYRDGEFQLMPHCKENYNTSQLPVKYNRNSKAPQFIKFLHDIFHDSDKEIEENKIRLLTELIGYSLTTSCEFEKFIILIGSGANGKSVLLNVIESLVGLSNIAAVQPSQFNSKFQRAHLDGKLINVVTEIAEGAVIADAELKAIVSGELTTAEHKNRDPFDFHPFATCWFGTNHMPHTRDFSDALQRRAEILQFPHKFIGKHCDPKLKEKLILELEGILMISLNALSDVYKKGMFSKCSSSEEAKLEWRKEADQTAQFVDECCTENLNGKVEVGDLYDNYNDWAKSSGIKNSLGKNSFSKRLENLGYIRSRGTGGTRFFNGLKVEKNRRVRKF